jgi:hypothetical protein
MREYSAEIRAERPHLRYVLRAGMPTAEEQWEWLETKMKASTADYLRVPGWSLPRAVRLLARSGSGHARETQAAARNVHASGYMCGHDPCQEHIDEGKGPVCVLSGSRFECCYPGTNAHKVPEGAIKMAYWLGERPEGAECPNNKAASLATGKAAFQRL